MQQQAQVEIVGVAGAVPLGAAGPPRVAPTRPGWPSRSAATTPARSASCRACAAARRTAGPATCWPRSGRWSRTGWSRSRCSGQNVNSYGAAFGDRLAFGKLLRACGGIDGLERVRFTSPHPRDFTDDVIDAMAQTPERHAAAAHAAAVRLGRRAAGDAARLPPGEVPGDPGQGPRGHAGRRDHDRHHRGLPRRDRAGLRRHPGRRAPGPVRRSVHVPVLDPAGHPRGGDGRPGTAGGRRRSGTSGWPRWSRRPRWPGTGRSPGARSRCSSPTARAARTR